MNLKAEGDDDAVDIQADNTVTKFGSKAHKKQKENDRDTYLSLV